MRRGTVVVVIVVVAVAAVLLVRGVPWRRGPEVVLVGDSITAQSEPVFEDKLGSRWGLTMQGEPGHRSDELLPAVPALAEHHPVQVVVNLGTNDVMQRKDPAETEAALEQLALGFSGARCVHLVTVNEHMVRLEDPGLTTRITDLNTRIRDLAARHGWDTIPWDEIVKMYDVGPQPEGPITVDTVHPTDYGEHVLADAYGDALDECAL
jgi:lysophospholipase L1-like esterase